MKILIFLSVALLSIGVQKSVTQSDTTVSNASTPANPETTPNPPPTSSPALTVEELAAIVFKIQEQQQQLLDQFVHMSGGSNSGTSSSSSSTSSSSSAQPVSTATADVSTSSGSSSSLPVSSVDAIEATTNTAAAPDANAVPVADASLTPPANPAVQSQSDTVVSVDSAAAPVVSVPDTPSTNSVQTIESAPTLLASTGDVGNNVVKSADTVVATADASPISSSPIDVVADKTGATDTVKIETSALNTPAVYDGPIVFAELVPVNQETQPAAPIIVQPVALTADIQAIAEQQTITADATKVDAAPAVSSEPSPAISVPSVETSGLDAAPVAAGSAVVTDTVVTNQEPATQVIAQPDVAPADSIPKVDTGAAASVDSGSSAPTSSAVLVDSAPVVTADVAQPEIVQPVAQVNNAQQEAFSGIPPNQPVALPSDQQEPANVDTTVAKSDQTDAALPVAGASAEPAASSAPASVPIVETSASDSTVVAGVPMVVVDAVTPIQENQPAAPQIIVQQEAPLADAPNGAASSVASVPIESVVAVAPASVPNVETSASDSTVVAGVPMVVVDAVTAIQESQPAAQITVQQEVPVEAPKAETGAAPSVDSASNEPAAASAPSASVTNVETSGSAVETAPVAAVAQPETIQPIAQINNVQQEVLTVIQSDQPLAQSIGQQEAPTADSSVAQSSVQIDASSSAASASAEPAAISAPVSNVETASDSATLSGGPAPAVVADTLATSQVSQPAAQIIVQQDVAPADSIPKVDTGAAASVDSGSSAPTSSAVLVDSAPVFTADVAQPQTAQPFAQTVSQQEAILPSQPVAQSNDQQETPKLDTIVAQSSDLTDAASTVVADVVTTNQDTQPAAQIIVQQEMPPADAPKVDPVAAPSVGSVSNEPGVVNNVPPAQESVVLGTPSASEPSLSTSVDDVKPVLLSTADSTDSTSVGGNVVSNEATSVVQQEAPAIILSTTNDADASKPLTADAPSPIDLAPAGNVDGALTVVVNSPTGAVEPSTLVDPVLSASAGSPEPSSEVSVIAVEAPAILEISALPATGDNLSPVFEVTSDQGSSLPLSADTQPVASASSLVEKLVENGPANPVSDSVQIVDVVVPPGGSIDETVAAITSAFENQPAMTDASQPAPVVSTGTGEVNVASNPIEALDTPVEAASLILPQVQVDSVGTPAAAGDLPTPLADLPVVESQAAQTIDDIATAVNSDTVPPAVIFVSNDVPAESLPVQVLNPVADNLIADSPLQTVIDSALPLTADSGNNAALPEALVLSSTDDDQKQITFDIIIPGPPTEGQSTFSEAGKAPEMAVFQTGPSVAESTDVSATNIGPQPVMVIETLPEGNGIHLALEQQSQTADVVPAPSIVVGAPSKQEAAAVAADIEMKPPSSPGAAPVDPTDSFQARLAELQKQMKVQIDAFKHASDAKKPAASGDSVSPIKWLFGHKPMAVAEVKLAVSADSNLHHDPRSMSFYKNNDALHHPDEASSAESAKIAETSRIAADMAKLLKEFSLHLNGARTNEQPGWIKKQRADPVSRQIKKLRQKRHQNAQASEQAWQQMSHRMFA